MPNAIRFHELGGPEVLKFEEVPARKPGAGEVLLKVEAVGLNRAESMYFHGAYMEKVNLPSGLGYEAVGKVLAVGDGVDAGLVGKRFGTIPGFSMNQYPVLAEEAVVPERVLAAVPGSYSAVEGAAVWMQYCTAYGALVLACVCIGAFFAQLLAIHMDVVHTIVLTAIFLTIAYAHRGQVSSAF